MSISYKTVIISFLLFLKVKVWFQNRRMKWRHTRETKINQEKSASGSITRDMEDIKHETSSSSDEDEIDVVAE